MPIRVLSAHLVNKIAAGEVIERPASVVKELVENALDAGSTRIEVAIEEGGRKLISVCDNGGGMSAEDLALAFVPHATSKISAEDDLFRIETMGFRGEALASIASIAHAHIRTRKAGSDAGYEIEASGETVAQVRPCPAATGTAVAIRDLFFNTPARRKFMRAVNTEMGQIAEQITRLALPHPQVAFRLTHNGRETLKLPAAATTLERVGDIFGRELSDTLLTIPGGDAVAGLISRPAVGRATAQCQYVFLNGRYIRDRSLSHAIKEAYRGLGDPSRHPVAFLFLTIDPAEVDVNVHPTKIEVRFRDSHAVYGRVLGAMKDTLNRANLSPSASLDGHGAYAPAGGAGPSAEQALVSEPGAPADSAAAMSAGDQKDEARRQSLRQALADFFRSMPPPQPRLSFPESTPYARKASAGPDEQKLGGLYASESPGTAGTSPTTGPAMAPSPAAQAATSPAIADAPGDGAGVGASPAALQIHNSYIVAPGDDGILIIDQHALHERLVYNDLKRRLAGGGLSGQRLLIPQVVNVSPSGAQALVARADLLARLGMELVSFGPSSVAIQQFPSMLTSRGVLPEEFVREMAERLLENESAEAENLLEELLSVLACKAAVKAGDALSASEIQSLLERRLEAEKASSCPHGRPTTLTLSLKDLEKQFKRT